MLSLLHGPARAKLSYVVLWEGTEPRQYLTIWEVEVRNEDLGGGEAEIVGSLGMGCRWRWGDWKAAGGRGGGAAEGKGDPPQPSDPHSHCFPYCSSGRGIEFKTSLQYLIIFLENYKKFVHFPYVVFNY